MRTWRNIYLIDTPAQTVPQRPCAGIALDVAKVIIEKRDISYRLRLKGMIVLKQ